MRTNKQTHSLEKKNRKSKARSRQSQAMRAGVNSFCLFVCNSDTTQNSIGKWAQFHIASPQLSLSIKCQKKNSLPLYKWVICPFFLVYSFIYEVLLFLPNVTVKSALKTPKRVLLKEKTKNSAPSRIAKRHTPFSSPMMLLHTRATSFHELLSALSILLSSCFFISLSRLERLAYYAKRSVVVVVVVHLEWAELVTAITGKEALFQLNLLAFISPLLSPPPFFFLFFYLLCPSFCWFSSSATTTGKKNNSIYIYIYHCPLQFFFCVYKLHT